jgi:serine/threonine protein kinase
MTREMIPAALAAGGTLTDIVPVSDNQQNFAASAINKLTGRRVFVKATEYVAEFSEAILREPRQLTSATADIAADNVVKLLGADIMTIGEQRYLVLQMEHVEGTSLSTVVGSGPIGQQRAVRIAAGIALGLAALHRRRILHRDLKPPNVMLRADDVALITDFGSAVVIPSGQEKVPTNNMYHSLLNVPPEGWEKPAYYCAQSDVYQLGLILYQLVHGELADTAVAYFMAEHVRALQRVPDHKRRDQEDRCMRDALARRTRNGTLLSCGRGAVWWVADAIHSIIRKCTNPRASQRPSAFDLAQSLGKTDVPDWTPTDGALEARGWRGHDWIIRSRERRTGVSWTLLKRRAGVGSFRRFGPEETDRTLLLQRAINS